MSFLNRKISLMMVILGILGFFEWAIIAEDEIVENITIQVANISDPATSEEWTRLISDEQLHIEKIKREVLDMER